MEILYAFFFIGVKLALTVFLFWKVQFWLALVTMIMIQLTYRKIIARVMGYEALGLQDILCLYDNDYSVTNIICMILTHLTLCYSNANCWENDLRGHAQTVQYERSASDQAFQIEDCELPEWLLLRWGNTRGGHEEFETCHWACTQLWIDE